MQQSQYGQTTEGEKRYERYAKADRNQELRGLRWQGNDYLNNKFIKPWIIASLTSLLFPPLLYYSLNEPDDEMSSLSDPTSFPSSTEIALATPTSLSNDTLADASADQEVLGTSSQAIIACNSISVTACILVIVVYALLHRKYTRIMQRTSLVLSCAMATADLLLHVSGPFLRNEDVTCDHDSLFHSTETIT